MDPIFDTDLHGNPKGMRLVIGFTNVYYTLWKITVFNKVEHVQYLQNLSMDFSEAQAKVVDHFKKEGCDCFEIDMDLKGDSGYSFFRPLAAKRYEPELFAISSYAGTDMRSVDPHHVYRRAEYRYDGELACEEKRFSGILWATYLNADEKTVRGLRRRIIARQCLVNAGILVKVGKEYLTANKIKAIADKAILDTAANGHHFKEGERVTLTVRRVGKIFSFDTQYGTTYIMTLIDEHNRLFKYMGSKSLELPENEKCTIKGTVKYGEYKGVLETKLQRIKVA